MYLNENEEKIIATFCQNLDKTYGKELLLKWDEGSIVATFDTCFEDEDDETDEEFYSFSFAVISKTGNPPVFITSDNYFLIDYKNFPKQILLENIKIN
jgi:hypothetical protein